MRYEIYNLMDDGQLELAFSSGFRGGALTVAKAMVDCAKRDGYEYQIFLWDSYLQEKVAEFRNF